MSCCDVIIVNFKEFASYCEVGENTFKIISKCLKKKSLKGVIQDFINLKSVPGVSEDVVGIIAALEVALEDSATDKIFLDEVTRKSFFLFAYYIY